MTSHVIPPGYFERPAVVRVQDYFGGGKDHYAVDRQLGRTLRAVAPWLPGSVRVNRAHGARVLNHLSRELGIDQVIDLGCGLPHEGNRSLPDEVRRIVYVDSDPAVAAHARVCLAERSGTAALLADLTDLRALLAAGEIERLDHDRPIGVLLHDVLPWLDDESARAVVRTLHACLPQGSVLSLTHATGDLADEGQMRLLTEVYQRAGILFRPRTGAAVQALLGPWTPLDGRTPAATAAWRPPSAAFNPPPFLRPGSDHSHAYALLVTTGDRTT
ncbi:SAM-dependent methyltransferase [Streptomyces sp. NPDC046985]|uniref:SAM-dependent methyltransferase n=1 Tax=Streptomyces sp. NPDC046985 TaxID=3155377 RepID=UPI0033CE4A3B